VERAALLERLSLARAPIRWRTVTAAEVIAENAQARTIVLDVPDWPGHLAGQHVDVRLTADDGYQAQRSYSIASAPEDPRLALTVERIDDGEVSPYLAGELRAGDEFEIRGPVGGHFIWRVQDGGPLLLVAGGSGLVPLMAMLRHRAAQGSDVEARLLLSARSVDDVLYRDELATLDGVRISYTLTRERPADWTGYDRRVDAEMLADVGPAPSEDPKIFVCGPTAFVEQAAESLVSLGHEPAAIRTERFGPTGR
jgi:ferredoxin-NADP reductase